MNISDTGIPRYQVAARRIGSVSVFVVVNMGLQIVAQMLIAHQFGAGQNTDSYFMARDMADLLGKFFITGQITVVLMPLFIEYQSQKGPEEGVELMRQVINLIILGAGGLLVLTVAGAPLLVKLMAPGFVPEAKALTVGMFRILLLSTFITLLVSVAAAVLNAFQRFSLPRATAGLMPLGLIVAILLFKPWGGIYTLAWGLVLGNAIQAVVLFGAAHKEGLRWRAGLRPWSNEAVRRFLLLMVPFIGAYVAASAQGIVFKVIVSYFPAGNLSSLSYASRIMKALFSVTITAFNVVIFHTLARQAAGGKMEAMAETTAKSLQMLLFVLLPLTAVGMALATPTVQILLERGSFTRAATTLTASLLLIYLAVIPLLGCSSFLTNVLYSLQETRVVVKIGIGAALIQGVLYWPLSRLLGLHGLVWASICSSAFLALAGYFVVVRRVKPLKGRLSVRFLGQVSLASVVSWGTTRVIHYWCTLLLGQATIGTRIIDAVFASLFGSLAFVLVVSFMGLEEAKHLWNLILVRFRSSEKQSMPDVAIPSAEAPPFAGKD